MALSRATSLEGLVLLGYRRDRIRADPRVLAWYDSIQQNDAKRGGVRGDDVVVVDDENSMVKKGKVSDDGILII